MTNYDELNNGYGSWNMNTYDYNNRISINYDIITNNDTQQCIVKKYLNNRIQRISIIITLKCIILSFTKII